MIDKNIAEIFYKRLRNKCSYEDRLVMESVLSSYELNKTSIMWKLKILCDVSIIPDNLKIPAKRLYEEFSKL